MAKLLLEVLPLALGAMVSPLLLIIQVLTLTGKNKPLARASALLAGGATTLAIVTVALATVGKGLSIDPGQGSDPVGAALRGLCALLLVILGARSLARRNEGQRHRADRLATARTRGYFVAGLVVMLTNVTSLVLYIPAMHLVSTSSSGLAAQITATAMLYLFTMLPLLLPFAIAVALGPKSASVLAAMNQFVTKHNAVINSAICFIFAAYLTYGAISSI